MIAGVLQRNGLSTEGVAIKAVDGVLANIRWDLKVDSYQFYWEMLNHKSETNANFQRLAGFAVGVAGGAGIPRGNYLFDNVNLPEVSKLWSGMCIVCIIFFARCVGGEGGGEGSVQGGFQTLTWVGLVGRTC